MIEPAAFKQAAAVVGDVARRAISDEITEAWRVYVDRGAREVVLEWYPRVGEPRRLVLTEAAIANGDVTPAFVTRLVGQLVVTV